MSHFSLIGLTRLAAWAAVIVIGYATLTNVGFVYSLYFKLAPSLLWPGMRNYARFEHVIAFAVFGALFSLAYPRRMIGVCVVVLGSAILLEYLQTLTPDRHGTFMDAVEKLAGGALGISLASAVVYVWRRNHPPAL